MKTVKITIKGDLIVVDYCSKKVMEEAEDDGFDKFCSNYYKTCGWDKVEGMYVDVNEDDPIEDCDNVVKKKGKYVKTIEYFHDLFKEDGEHSLPVEVHTKTYYDQQLSYDVELEDDEEFDIKKVQLVKSDYEVDAFPYFILAEKILYDGNDVDCADDYMDYEVENKCYNEYEITRFMPI